MVQNLEIIMPSNKPVNIKAPAVDKLEDLKRIIRSLEFISIPYSFVDTQHLNEMKKNRKLSAEVYKQINEWKKSNNINLAKGYLQPIVSLLKALRVIESMKLEKSQLNRPLGINGPILNTFIDQKIETVKLTSIGYILCDLLKKNDKVSIKKYDEILFWLFLTGRISHNFNRLIENSNSFNIGIEKVLKIIETDERSRGIFLKWIDYFDLKGINFENINLKVLSRKKIAKKILCSTVLELNTLQLNTYPVKELVSKISKILDLSASFVNFLHIFEIIITKIKLVENMKDILKTSTGSRNELALPHFPKINMMRINKEISLDIFLDNISDKELNSIQNFSD